MACKAKIWLSILCRVNNNLGLKVFLHLMMWKNDSHKIHNEISLQKISEMSWFFIGFKT